MSGKGRTMLILVSERRPQLFKDALIAALGIAVAVGAPGRAQIPSGLTEVWPTDTLATIQTAVDSGGVVYFQPGTYSWTGALVITNTVELTAPKPTGNFDTGTGKDDRVWKAKITKSPIGIWDPNIPEGAPLDPIIQINCPGKTENVTISNLNTECLSSGMCIALGGGGNSARVSNCRMKTIDDGYGFVSWLANTRSVTVENCHVEAGTAGFLYPDGTSPNTDCIVFGTSNHATIEARNNIAVNHCDTLDVSTAVEVVWNQNPDTQVAISNNWLRTAGEGYAIFYYDCACSIGTVSHNTLVGNYSFLHYENSGTGGIIEGNRFECSGGGIVSLYFKDSSEVTVQGNTWTGSVQYGGIILDGDSSHNVFMVNDTSDLNAGAAHIFVQPECHNNLFARNVIGPLGPSALAGVQCSGDKNYFVRDDYSQSGILGVTACGIPCVWLANTYDPETGVLLTEPERNFVFESDGFPPGTDAAEQVLDDPREFTGTTTNIVIGH